MQSKTSTNLQKMVSNNLANTICSYRCKTFIVTEINGKLFNTISNGMYCIYIRLTDLFFLCEQEMELNVCPLLTGMQAYICLKIAL